MKILIDLLHPAHCHFFKNFIWGMEKKGHRFIVLSRDKECALELLNKYKIKNICLSKIPKNKIGLGLEFMDRLLKTIKIINKEKPDVLVGIMGAVIAPAGKLTKIPSYVFYDTENAKLTNRYVYNTATKFITPSCYEDIVPFGKHIVYDGYHELAYLHPDRFKPKIIEEFKDCIVLRLVSWQASHDIRDKGITDIPKLIKELEKYGKVVITSEKEIPKEFDKYKIPCSIEDIHHLLASAKLLIGESHTMASEAVCLGTPAITISKSRRGYTNDQEKYGLVFNCSNQEEAIKALNKIDFSKIEENHRKMMEDKIDVTSFMIELIEKDF